MDQIDGVVSEANERVVQPLIKRLEERKMLHGALIGSDGEEGVSIRWPSCGLFCEIWDGLIHVSYVGIDGEVVRDSFSSNEMDDVCERIERLK